MTQTEKWSLSRSYEGAPAGTLVEVVSEFKHGRRTYVEVRLPDGRHSAVPKGELWGPVETQS